MDNTLIPYIPETAPFTTEQRAYLNGFFAGFFSRVLPQSQGSPTSSGAPALPALTILFGSQTGNAEALAKRLARAAAQKGFAPTVIDLAQYSVEKLKSEERLLLITSTYGDGDPPDNAKAFWDFVRGSQAPELPNLKFSILALGDSNYPKFCECGKVFDLRLEELGAERISPRVDCDVDFEPSFCAWSDSVLTAMSSQNAADSNIESHGGNRIAGLLGGGAVNSQSEGTISLPGMIQLPGSRLQQHASDTEVSAQRFNRANPFPAVLSSNRLLNVEGSSKETRHFEL
jgi:sulfite reductase alpha subunit-like flavoprotein